MKGGRPQQRCGRSPSIASFFSSFFFAHRIKILFLSCILFALLALTRHTSSIMGWHLHPFSGSGSNDSREGYTVLINTWKRNDLLRRSVAHYGSCKSVDAIRIVWSESNPPDVDFEDSLLKSLKGRSDGNEGFLQFDLHPEDDLNNRFKPIEGLRTRAIFSIDDDVLVPCPTLEFAFSVWRSAPDSMVGFVPRMHWSDSRKHHLSQLHYTYGGWWSIWWTGTYSMVLTKASFLHKKYLEMYTYHMPASIRSFVRTGRNCEDIAMSFLVANVTHAPPIWVKGKIHEIGFSGISSLRGHNKRRTNCLNHFAHFYGGMPLVPSNVKVVDANYEWFW